jgi:hypothetical protein
MTWSATWPRGLTDRAARLPARPFIVAGSRTGLDVISNSGTLTRRIAVPAPVLSCAAARWRPATTVLALCLGRAPYATSRLWLLSAEPAVASRKVNMSLRRADAWPSRLEAESRHGLVPMLILGCPRC